MRNLILLIITTFISFNTKAQDVYIPDVVFLQALIDAGVDSNSDGIIQKTEAESVTIGFNFKSKNISDLTGINSFINIKELNCSGTSITTLDVTSLSKLQFLYCQINGSLVSINASGLVNLIALHCHYCSLTNLNISGCPHLIELYCWGNSLSTINLNGLTTILRLKCGDNPLTTLDVSNLTTLWELECYKTLLVTLDLSNLSNLKSLNIYRSKLTTLDVSNLFNLDKLNCHTNELTNLDITGTNLSLVICYNNYLSFKGMESTAFVSPSTTVSRNPQYLVFEENSITIGDEIDYTSEVRVLNKDVVFEWYQVVDGGTDILKETNTTGTFIPTESGIYYTKMTHTFFNDISFIQSKNTTVNITTSINQTDKSSDIKIVKTYNLSGQKVQKHISNQPVIVEYNNGKRELIFNYKK